MPEFLLLVVIALVVAALVFGVAALVTGNDPGLTPVEPDGISRGLPGDRPLAEHDLANVRFDVAFRGYRMSQVDAAMARAAYDIGFKQELIEALRSEVEALRDGRTEDAEALRRAREAAAGIVTQSDEVSRAEDTGLVAGEQADESAAERTEEQPAVRQGE